MKRKIAFALIMGLLTTGIISFLLISVHVGFAFLHAKAWMKSWLLAYLIAIPAILIIAPQIEKLAHYLFPDKKQ